MCARCTHFASHDVLMYERLVVPQLLQVIDGINVAFIAFGNSYSGMTCYAPRRVLHL